ncbi:MAG: M56 family metallopeptidase [Pseudomonadota bacterium]
MPTEALAVEAIAAFDLRALLRVVLFSLALTLLGRSALRRNPSARRTLLLSGIALLALLPLLLGATPLTLPVGMQEQPLLSLSIPLPSWLLLLWLLPAAALLTRTLISVRRVRRTLLALPAVTDRRLTAQLQELAADLGTVTPQLRIGEATCALGGRRPVVVLAEPLLEGSASADGVRAALVHELVHLRRRDDRALLLTQLAIDLYWWMPWLKGLARALETAIEESCDDRAADLFSPGDRYLAGVVDASRAECSPPARSQAVTYMSAHPLLARVLRFGERREFDPDWPGSLASVGALALALLLVTGVQPVPLPRAEQRPAERAPLPLMLERPALVRATGVIPAVDRLAVSANEPALLRALRADARAYLPLPVYPGSALRAGIGSEIAVRYRVLRDGSIGSLSFPDSHPAHAPFERTVRAALKASRYPALHRVRTTLPLEHWQARQTGPPLMVMERYRFALQEPL